MAGFTRGSSHPGYPPRSLQECAESFQASLESVALLKDEPETRIWSAADGDEGTWFYKQYRIPALRMLYGWAARSRASREYKALLAMDLEGLPVAVPMWWAESRIGPFLRSSVLVTRGLGKVEPLPQWLAANPERGRQGEVLAGLGLIARRLHDLGFGHFRMQAKNFMVLEGEQPTLHMIDVPYACLWRRPASASVRMLDLEDLAGSHSVLDEEQVDALMSAYRGEGDPECPDVLGDYRPGSRSRWGQKLRRIAYYLGAIWSGNRPG